MFKFKISAEEFAKLEAGHQGFYKQEGDVYVLQVDGIEDGDTAGLKRQNETLLSEVKDAKKRLADLEAESQRKLDEEKSAREEAEREAARKKGDVSAIEEGYKKQIQELNDQLAAERTSRENSELDRAAQTVAGGLSSGANSEILQRFVRDRLRWEDGKVKVQDAEGHLNGQTLEALAEEFRGSDRYASLINGSSAGGGGASSQDKQGGGAAKTMNRADFDAADQATRASFVADGGKVVDD